MFAILFLDRAMELIGLYHNLEKFLHLSMVEGVIDECIFRDPHSSLIMLDDGFDQVWGIRQRMMDAKFSTSTQKITKAMVEPVKDNIVYNSMVTKIYQGDKKVFAT